VLKTEIVQSAQKFLQQETVSGWLVYDYLSSNPVFRKIITPNGHVTRPCMLFIPPTGPPSLLCHHVDAGKFSTEVEGSISSSELKIHVYSHRTSFIQLLEILLSGSSRVAMEYSPLSQLPRVSRVDAGTIELIQTLGVEVTSSENLMQYATQRWSHEQLQGHIETAQKLGQIVKEAFHFIGTRLHTSGPSTKESEQIGSLNEFDVAEYIRVRFKEEALESPDGPIVSVNAHCSDPHYEPSLKLSSPIKLGDWVLIDLWARNSKVPNSIYADITWTAYVGNEVPEEQQKVFDIVISARDAALQYLKDSFIAGKQIQGWEVDSIARNYISEQGYADHFTHRLGHSINNTVHGEAVNLDDFETHDTRHIIPGIGFSIEPGIYLAEFGVRSEIDAYMSAQGPYATSPVQTEIVLIKPE